MSTDDLTVEPIAIIGMAARLPGADSVDEFWRNQRDGVESITRFDTAGTPDLVGAAGILSHADEFDAAFFGFTPREAEVLDPQHRVLLECAWAAFEDAAHDPAAVPGPAGVFAGCFMNKYLSANLLANARFARSPAAATARIYNDKDFLATRVAHALDLRGPALTVQTACSTSLVAVHLACQSLLGYECDLALAGGVTINVPVRAGYPAMDGGLFAAEGRCRPFDHRARGTVPGNGAAMVLLRRLSDALADGDQVYAVIKGTAINNDGALKGGFTAPSVDAQAEVIGTAQLVAGIGGESIGYVEAHGTGTRVGDPIEIAALTKAFRLHTDRRGYCALGAVKANIGHLDAAAGVAGLMRAALALRHGVIPPLINFAAPNPELSLGTSPFYVPTAATEWPRVEGAPRRAAVGSLGVGGTNAHAVLEESPAPAASEPGRPWQLLPLSARTPEALAALGERLAQRLSADPEAKLTAVAGTLQRGRRAFPVRRFVIGDSTASVVRALREPPRIATATHGARTAFLFPGVGTQYADMGAGLYRSETVYRAAIDECAASVRPRLGIDLRAHLYRSAGAERPAADHVPAVLAAIFATEYATARLWQSWGVEPAAMLGHSLGEYAAACLSGVFTLEDALDLTVRRGELMTRIPAGRMLAVQLSEEAIGAELSGGVGIAALNAPESTTVSGPAAEIEALRERLARRGVACRTIRIHMASHSALVEPYLDEFAATVARYRLGEPRIPFLSGVTGTWIEANEATDPRYWARHLRQPVRFADGLARLARTGPLLEVGPGTTLTSLIAAQRFSPRPVAVASLRHPGDPQADVPFLLTAAGRLWQGGVELDWAALTGQTRPQRVSLPTYPFERRRYWIEPDAAPPIQTNGAPPTQTDGGHPTLTNGGHPARTNGAHPTRTNGAHPARSDGAADQWDQLHSNGSGHGIGGPAVRQARTADPATIEHERRLTAAWQEILGVPDADTEADFFELGGNSLTAAQLTKWIRDTYGAPLTVRDLFETPTIAGLAKTLAHRTSGVTVRALDVRPELPADVRLDPEITPEGAQPARTGPAAAVLLTGATGYLGSFLCAELLARTDAVIHCLVRADSIGQGGERLRRTLAARGVSVTDLARVVAVPGDLARPRLGLSEDVFDELARQIDAIYHCGAAVNFVRPYRSLRAANVAGTQEILRLAARTRITPVHHVSTLAVLAGAFALRAPEVTEDGPLPPPIGHDTGYSESKWVAEGVAGLAQARGLPVSIYRPSIILGDSRTGAANADDYLTKMIHGCVELGAAPLRDYPLAVATVDYVAAALVTLSLRPGAHGGVHHLVDPRPLPWNSLFDHIRQAGHPLRALPYDQWLAELTAALDAGHDNTLAPLIDMLATPADRFMSRIDCAATVAGLAGTGIVPPALDAGYFATMLRHFTRAGTLPTPPPSHTTRRQS